MEVDEDLSETNLTEECSESFGDISCIIPDTNEKESSDKIDTDVSNKEASITVSSDEDSYDPTSLIEVSDILGLVGKKWSIFHVSPLWNLHFHTENINESCEKLNLILLKHIETNVKKSFLHISVNIEPKEAHHENIALKIEVRNKETNTQLYTGILLKSPKYTENYDKNNLSDMPILMVQGNKSIIAAVHNWLTNHFDCVIRTYEFALYQFLLLIALSIGDAGQSFNETVVYHYLYQYELSKGQMNIKCHVESELLRSILAKVSLNHSFSVTTIHYSDLIKAHSEIEDFFQESCGINVAKLKLKAFEAPKVASISVSGKIGIESSSLMDLILKHLMEEENNKCLS